MIAFLSTLYFFYVIVKVYVSIMQIGYVARAKEMKPVMLSSTNYIKAANYLISGERTKIVELLVEYALFLFWIGLGIKWLDRLTWNLDLIWQGIIAVDLFLIVNYLILLPFSIYKTFVIDERFGFNQSTPELFLRDQMISGGMILAVASVLSAVVVWLMQNVQYWWLVSFVVIFGVVVLLNMLYPTLIAPLFNRFKPLEDETLEARIDGLMQKTGFKSEGVFVVDASKRDNRLNAYFGGLGKTKRVVLFDTLLQKLTPDEIVAVLGHELGHFTHRDVFKNLFMAGSVMLGGFYIFGHLPYSIFVELGIQSSPAMVMILFLLLFTLLAFLFMPLISFVSRKNEYAADQFACQVADRGHLVNALKKLIEENKSFPKSHPLVIFFYYSHPPILERLKALGERYEEGSDESLRGSCAL